MSILERGRDEAAAREEDRQQREQNELERLQKRVRKDFLQRFYDDHIIVNPEYTGMGSKPRLIWDPDNPPPELEDWRPISSGTMGDSTFFCEGIRYICRWQYHGGTDLAYWDDGWWPDWFVVIKRPRKWLPFLRHDVEHPVGGPAQVAEAMGWGRTL